VLAEEKNQEIVVAGETGVSVYADRVFMRMVLINLLENAVKYSPECSRVSVTCKNATTNGELGSWVELSVADEGPGIEAEERVRIFDRYYRSHGVRTRNTSGTGLGLAIAKWVVEAHHGRITLAPSVGGGSLFTVRLPSAQMRDSKSPVAPALLVPRKVAGARLAT
jgi:signal transduction histidine kinase